MEGAAGMRYERLAELLRLAIHLQGSRGGLTIAAIQDEFSVSRRTAERMRDAVEAAFGPLEAVDADTGDRRIRWRLQSRALPPFLRILPEELAELETTADSLERTGLEERASGIRELAIKLRAALRRYSAEEFDSALESLMEAEGLAMRAGPRESLEEGLLSLLRNAIKAGRVVEFGYLAQWTERRSHQRVQPYGVLYGNRVFLVGRTDWANDTRLWRLANMSYARITNETFDRDPTFDLRRYAKRSFGTFQEEPVEVALRFDPSVASDVTAFLFHPDQTISKNNDGSLTVRFTAGGINEMCWHLFTWGDSVTVEHPKALRQRLAQMCSELTTHHTA